MVRALGIVLLLACSWLLFLVLIPNTEKAWAAASSVSSSNSNSSSSISDSSGADEGDDLSGSGSGSDQLDELFNASETAPAAGGTAGSSGGVAGGGALQSDTESQKILQLGDLAYLAPFDDVVVIEKRFLPKTRRFELNASVTSVLNDLFFLGFGVSGRLAFHFQERMGLEAIGTFITTQEKDMTKSLRSERRVSTQSFITPEGFFGLDFKYIPIYGKLALHSAKILSFDHYFSAGFGLTNTNQANANSLPTLHIATGQIFAITQSSAFRWDLSWNFFQADSPVSAKNGKESYNTLMLNLGYSFYFPKARYR